MALTKEQKEYSYTTAAEIEGIIRFLENQLIPLRKDLEEINLYNSERRQYKVDTLPPPKPHFSEENLKEIERGLFSEVNNYPSKGLKNE